MIIAAIIAVLVAGGVYLVMQRGMMRLILGVTLISHAVNVLILATGNSAWRQDPLMDRATAGEAADPLPQAFVLTAIVISMAATAVLLALTALGRDDDTRNPEDPERTARRNRVLNTTGHGLNRAGSGDRLAKQAADQKLSEETSQGVARGADRKVTGRGGNKPHIEVEQKDGGAQ